MYGYDLYIDDEYKNWGGLKNQVRGFGYWCYKPCVILEVLRQIDDGDFLLYLDIGFEFCNGYDDVIKDMLEQVDKNDIMSLQINDDFLSARKWSKMDFLRHFGLDKDEKFLDYPQVQAGFLCMKKSQKTIDIVNQWMDFFINHFDLVDDTPSKLPNLSSFIEHRHDQSVLSALMYLNDCVNFDEKFYKEGNGGFPFLCNRNKQFLFSDKNNVIIECDNGYLKFVYINAYSKFLELHNKKANFLKKYFRIYYKFPRWIMKNYKSLLKN